MGHAPAAAKQQLPGGAAGLGEQQGVAILEVDGGGAALALAKLGGGAALHLAQGRDEEQAFGQGSLV